MPEPNQAKTIEQWFIYLFSFLIFFCTFFLSIGVGEKLVRFEILILGCILGSLFLRLFLLYNGNYFYRILLIIVFFSLSSSLFLKWKNEKSNFPKEKEETIFIEKEIETSDLSNLENFKSEINYEKIQEIYKRYNLEYNKYEGVINNALLIKQISLIFLRGANQESIHAIRDYLVEICQSKQVPFLYEKEGKGWIILLDLRISFANLIDKISKLGIIKNSYKEIKAIDIIIDKSLLENLITSDIYLYSEAEEELYFLLCKELSSIDENRVRFATERLALIEKVEKSYQESIINHLNLALTNHSNLLEEIIPALSLWEKDSQKSKELIFEIAQQFVDKNKEAPLKAFNYLLQANHPEILKLLAQQFANTKDANFLFYLRKNKEIIQKLAQGYPQNQEEISNFLHYINNLP